MSTHCQGPKTVVIEQAQMGAGVGVDAGVKDDSLLSVMSPLMCVCFAPDAYPGAAGTMHSGG